MEESPIEILKHHLEVLQFQYDGIRTENFQYRRMIRNRITKFEKSIQILNGIKL
jgi:hypothetical protein